MLKNSEERIILNHYIENDPLSEENLDKTLKYLHEFRLSFGNDNSCKIYMQQRRE